MRHCVTETSKKEGLEMCCMSQEHDVIFGLWNLGRRHRSGGGSCSFMGQLTYHNVYSTHSKC